MKLIKKLTALLLTGAISSSFCVTGLAAALSSEQDYYTFEVVATPDSNLKAGDTVKIEMYVKAKDGNDIVLSDETNTSDFKFSLKLPGGVFNLPGRYKKGTQFTTPYAGTMKANESKGTNFDTLTFSVAGQDMFDDIEPMTISASTPIVTFECALTDKVVAGQTYTVDFTKDNCLLGDGPSNTATQMSKIVFTTDSFTIASSGETSDFENVDGDQTVKDENQAAKKYDGKYLKHISTILTEAALSKRISIKCGDEERVSDRTIAETLGGIGVTGSNVTGTIAIGVLTSNENAVFTFDLVD